MTDYHIDSQFGRVKTNPGNHRTITPAAMALLKESIQRDREFMTLRPIVIDGSGMALGGNQRLRACVELGMDRLPDGWVVQALNLTPEQVKRFILIDNGPDGMTGDWDLDALVRDYSFDELGGLGFDLNRMPGFENPGDISQSPAPAVGGLANSQAGQLYLLGQHRLMCGDALSDADVAVLMDGRQADMCFTDPPYNVDYEGAAGKIANDAMTSSVFLEFLQGAMRQVIANTVGGIYVCMSSKEMPNLRQAFDQAGGHWSCEVVWVKDRFTLGRGDYQQQAEPILYGWPSRTKNHYFTPERNQASVWEDVSSVQSCFEDGQTVIRFLGFEVRVAGEVQGSVRRQAVESDVWRFDKPLKSEDHPTMKPLALCAQAIRNSSRKGQVVLDLFGGSGSTLMAAEQLGRRCFMLEMSPEFCDVIRRRWWTHVNGHEDGWQEGTACR